MENHYKSFHNTPKYHTLEILNSFTAIRRESSDSINRDNAPVLNLPYLTNIIILT